MTKQLLRPALFWLMTLTLLWSCQETLESPIDTSTDLSLAEAQSFYEQIQAQAKAVSQNSKANKRTQKTSRQAFWDKQEKYKAGSQELISIPVLFDDDLNTPGFGFKKMVFYKDTKTNKTNARIIEYIFDKTYLTKNFGNLSMKTFTGMMVVYDADGNYLDGVGVKDGKQTNKVGVALDGEIMKAKNANGRESATTINCEATYTGYNCDFGGGALGTASNTGTGYTPNDLLSKCTTVYVQFIGNCDSGGSGGSGSGFPYPLPALVAPNPWDTFSGFAGGGGGGYVYSGPNTVVSTEQQILTTLDISQYSLYDVQLALQRNQFALLGDCPLNIANWVTLARFTPPQSVLDRLKSLTEEQQKSIIPTLKISPNYSQIQAFAIQKLSDAAGTVVNCDYFPVRVEKLPTGFTADQLLTQIRLNINNSIDPTLSEFSGHPSIVGEQQRWISNPLGSIISIKIPGDRGSVIASSYSNNHWIFSTIHDPFNFDHPVSGNRKFGYDKNSDGSYTFYTQGVDRITGTTFDTIVFEMSKFMLGESIQFVKADELWRSLQNGIANFVNKNGGKAQVQPSVVKRPDWSEVSDVLTGLKSANTIKCK